MHEITILHVEGCEGARHSGEIARALAVTRGDVRVTDVLVGTEAEAVARGFRGSPTVLIDGRDIEADPQTPVGSMG